MKKAILLFHASQLGNNLHPFLLSEIDHFKDKFEQVYVCCLKPKCSTAEIDRIDNVHMVTIGLMPLYARLWLIIPELFTGYFWKDLAVAVRNKVFDLSYLKMTAMQLIYGRYFAKICNKLINESPEDEWVVDSYWLTGPAYAAAKIKRKNSRIIAFSRQHSFEADVERNKYAICQMKGFIDNYLDYIFFVSAKGKESYIKIIEQYYKNTHPQKYIVNRLGVEDYHGACSPSNDGVFRILSCSRVVSLKRVPLLAEVFSNWTGEKIEWYHIGDGEELDLVKKTIESGNPNADANCVLLGNLNHDEVMDFYKKHRIDLFINVSMFEGLPVSIMEALSFGVPVIATNAGATEELVNSTNGILLDRNTTKEQVSNAIRRILNLSNDEYNRLRIRAYDTYKELLDTNANFDVLLDTIHF